MTDSPAPASTTGHAAAPDGAPLRFLALAVSAAFLALLALAPLVYVAWSRLPPRVVTVDLQRLVEEDQARVVQALDPSTGLTAEQRTAFHQRTVDFAQRLSVAVEQIGRECQCVIVNKAALLGGMSPDYTDQVRTRMTP